MKKITHLTFVKENIFIVNPMFMIMENILTPLEKPQSKEILRYIVAHLVPSQTLMLLAINTFVELQKISR